MKKYRKLLGWICLLGAFLCIGYIVYTQIVKSENKNVYAKMQRQVAEDKKLSPEDVYISPIDFEKLRETNADIYAWIEIPGTAVNYPIVQSDTDDAYYLNHTIEGVEGYPGSIYTESVNAKDFSDYNTVVYGHNMKDGSMFRALHDYEDAPFMKEHQEIYVYTPEKKLTYRVFAAVEYQDAHIMYAYDFTTEEGRQSYLDSIYGSRSLKNIFNEEITADANSRILTLSTCIGGQNDKRFLVEAVLVDE